MVAKSLRGTTADCATARTKQADGERIARRRERRVGQRAADVAQHKQPAHAETLIRQSHEQRREQRAHEDRDGEKDADRRSPEAALIEPDREKRDRHAQDGETRAINSREAGGRTGGHYAASPCWVPAGLGSPTPRKTALRRRVVSNSVRPCG